VSGPKIWLTADTHYGHANIIKYCNRPFSSVEEMDEAMIRNHNAVVRPGDIWYHLGDFAMGRHDDYLSRLNGGAKHLIFGNHDHRNRTTQAKGWTSMGDIAHVQFPGIDIPVVLFHYAMRVWNRSHHGALHLYGHSHGTLPGDSQSCDVGVDCWGFKPITIDRAIARMKTQTMRTLPITGER